MRTFLFNTTLSTKNIFVSLLMCSTIMVLPFFASAQMSATISEILPQSCLNTSNGALRVVVQGGVAPYTYQWYDPNYNPIGVSNDTITGLTRSSTYYWYNEYYIEITDANGDFTDAYYTISAATSRANISTIASATCPNYNNGKMEVGSVSGITLPYTYLWSTGLLQIRLLT
jgi:hypothetical protein